MFRLQQDGRVFAIRRIFQSLPMASCPADRGICIKGNIALTNPGENSLKGVVVVLRNWIKLVLMTSRTIGGGADKRGHRLCHHIVSIKILKRIDRRGRRAMIVCACSDEPKSRHQVSFLGIQSISRQLLADKSIPRLVLIQAFDQIIAITPRVLSQHIMFISVRVRVVNRIHPMPCPAFAVTR